jgi:hypothetical protein
VLTNDGSGGFVTASTPGVGNVPYSVCAADVNGDGRPDLISANQLDNTLTVLTNNITFPPPPGLQIMAANNQMALVYPWTGKYYTLLTTTNLAAPVWLPATNSVKNSNNLSFATVTISNIVNTAFFRLSNP